MTTQNTDIRVSIVTLDRHLAAATVRAEENLQKEMPGLSLSLHAASDWNGNTKLLDKCREDIEQSDIIVASMLFMEDHVTPVIDSLRARRDHCDALVGLMSAQEVVHLTHMGRFDMSAKQGGPMAMLKRLRGERSGKNAAPTAGARQMAMLRRLPKILRYVPGKAQDLRAYFLSMQYWLASSDDNLSGMVRMLVNRYADGPRSALRGNVNTPEPVEYPENGLYHPSLPRHIGEDLAALPKAKKGSKGKVGLLVMRSYVLSRDVNHYDGVISALEAKGLEVIPAFASGLDARPAIEEYFIKDGEPQIDAVLSLTGFSLVGGPAYNDADAAEEILAALDVPYISSQAVEFQSLEEWHGSDRGLTPVEATMMVAIPELDGATSPMVFGGRSGENGAMVVDEERATLLADRVAKLISLRKTPVADRKLAVSLFCFPPNAGNVGTAAFLSVWASLYKTLTALKAEGYSVELPESPDQLREAVMGGNAARYGTAANVHERIAVDDHVRREPHLEEIEAQWGPAPGKQLSDGSSLFVLGASFGNVFVGVQPAFGYEGDPMRLLFEQGFSPTHAFSAFYRYLREDFAADAVLHFGTHGALEFMPGKQTGLTGKCWPDRLIGALPNFYLYAANNPSEGTVAKRRSAATLISYLTPSLAQAGLYSELLDLNESLKRYRGFPPEDHGERDRLLELIQAQAAAIDLVEAEPLWTSKDGDRIGDLTSSLRELEESLIPEGLHVLGETPDAHSRADLIGAIGEAAHGRRPETALLTAIADSASKETLRNLAGSNWTTEELEHLVETEQKLRDNQEMPSLMRALDGRFVRPAPGGDLLRTPDILPTGRNLHGFDPFRIPSAFALTEGQRQAELLLQRHIHDGHALPSSIALVLWGTDNLKTEGGPIGQALALIGARPRFDGYGRLTGAELIPLTELGRPRIDVLMTVSGIFRDLLPLQTKLLAEASYLAAVADEPVEKNFIRKHVLAYQQASDCDIETAALRVFSNADGAYGANVNLLLDSGRWQDEDEMAETYSRRKSFAYGRNGATSHQPELLQHALANVDLTYQNLESVELGVTTINHYFDTLGGISRSVQRASGGEAVPVYIGDQTKGEDKVRTLGEQIDLETRTRVLNPKWHEGMLEHGYEGVRNIEEHITNTLGWSATTGEVAPWVYRQISQTFVLDDTMRERLASLNPTAAARLANRLIEAHERQYWTPDADMLEALQRAGDELEDRIEGINPEAQAIS